MVLSIIWAFLQYKYTYQNGYLVDKAIAERKAQAI
nr:MAG TPA: hypothetical protein [Caudoviricetes sp.]